MDTEKLLLSVKKDVRALLVSSKQGLSPEELRKDYQNMLGHPIPLRVLGFHSVLDMAKEMADTLHLDYNLDGTVMLKAIFDENTKDMEELISKQRNRKHKPKSKSGGTGFFSSHSHHQHSFVFARRGQAPPALPAQLRSQFRQLLAHGPIGLTDLERCYAVHFGKPLYVTHYGFYSISEMLAAAADMITLKQTRMGSQLILKTEITPVKQKLSNTDALPEQSAGISSSSVLQDTAQFNNVQPGDQHKSEQTAASRVQEMKPATLLMEQKSFEKSVAKLEEELRKRILEHGESGTVSQELKDKLRKVVAEHSQGMAIHNLPTEYKKMYGEDLPLAQCGFVSVTEMVGALSDMFGVQPSTEEGAKDLHIMELKPNAQPEGHYFSCSETAWDCQGDGGESTESLDSTLEIEITNKVIHQTVNILPVTGLSRGGIVPLDAVRCQKLKPPTRRRVRDLVAVVVERIESPSHFYIRFDEDQVARTLENMMFEMRSCYSCTEVAERYQLPDAYVRPGQVCCVAPGDVWFYRVVIHRILSATEVEVYYADFGDLNVVSKNKLKFLKSCYAELPAQAVPSVLVGVRPVKSIWSKEATSLFQKLCCDHTLVAAVHSYQHDFLLLFLCDTHTEEDLYIHSKLQAEGHAVACAANDTLVSQQFSPVTLYFGDGQLEEVKEHLRAVTSPCVTNRQNLTLQLQQDSFTVPSQHLKDGIENQQQEMDLLDLPELEFIDVGQGENSNPFESLLKKDPESFGNWDQGWPNEASADDESKLLQNGQEESAKTALLSPVPFIKPDIETQPVLESKHTQKPASSPHTLLDQTPGLIRSCSHHTDKSAELFQPLPSRPLMFSMFSSGDRLAQDALFLRHTSPLALSPSARMAAGPSLLHWYKQTGLNNLAAPTGVCPNLP
ncbi:tudor domain-containing protein 5 isoform X1 [Hemibagrus wyckioides]|uniref:tudor domain-containing protein 5 isoform X1 n=1 Tax=Hemibagrus wyckioides TaxID=337641 RepID=UPI00266CA01F|nr:tudor domain-containing protein 5 isoform X1 [Hemibagrus wyckioides]